MLGINRRPENPDQRTPGRPVPGPLAVPSATPAQPAPGPLRAATASLPATPSAPPLPTPPIAGVDAPSTYEPVAEAGPVPAASDLPGSKLSVGPNIKLKGVEVSDCDVLIVEGHVEATVSSKAMSIAKPGTLNGIAVIDVAEIHGVFVGELTARTRLVVHGTGRVSGKIRYGKLIVAEGGELNGDVRQLDATDVAPARAVPLAADAAATTLQPQLLPRESGDAPHERIARAG
jgi:cytoskeletal protein CcmA (bactofilin family)